jgi:uncharacterized protein (TIGR00296 family)
VKTARNAISSYFSQQPPAQITYQPGLPDRRGIFVSLFHASNGHVLRGCVGDPFGMDDLINTLQKVAVEAAVNDYRFDPVTPLEFENVIVVDVNVLSEMESIWVKNPEDYVMNVEIGKHGLMVDGNGFRGLLLPQVAVEEGFDAEEFLCHCCMKAGLPLDSWLTGNVQISKFQTQIFEEETPKGHVVERHVDSSTK